MPALLLARVYALYLLVLDRTGAAKRLATVHMPLAAEHRAAWIAILLAWAVLLLYAALAAGRDRFVASFRAAMLVAAFTLPLAGLKVVDGPYRAPFVGGALLLLVVASIAHRSLARRREEGVAARLIERCRLATEVLGLVLFGVSTAAALTTFLEEAASVRLAFWSLILLRISISDLLRPSRMAEELGLKASAAKDLKSAVATPKGRKRKPRVVTRTRRALAGLGKLLVLVAWLALPLLSALARAEVSRGEWPKEALLLTFYPPAALVLTALYLIVGSVRGFKKSALTALRGLLVGLATVLYLVHAYRDPAFEAYRHSLPGLVLVEAVFGFLLGAATRKED